MPIVSICIPTYNRAEILNQSLESLVSQDIFQNTHDIEVIISDNCSTDNTKEIVAQYIAQYGDKIKYFRNEQNLKDENFYLSLSRGSGEFLKLCNDKFIYFPHSLENIINYIKLYQHKKPVLFFRNDMNATSDVKCSTVDEFVTTVSYLSTWLGGLGVWKEDMPSAEEWVSKSSSQLAQTDILLSMVAKKKYSIVINAYLFDISVITEKCNYNLTEVFSNNYLNILNKFLVKNLLSQSVYNQEKWKILKEFILPRQFNVKGKYFYDKSHFWKNTKHYHKDIKFYFMVLNFIKKKIKYSIKDFCCKRKK